VKTVLSKKSLVHFTVAEDSMGRQLTFNDFLLSLESAVDAFIGIVEMKMAEFFPLVIKGKVNILIGKPCLIRRKQDEVKRKPPHFDIKIKQWPLFSHT